MGRYIAFLYGVVSYLFFFATFLYAIGFVSDLAVPKTIDTGAARPATTALLVDIALMAAFALQHSIMARPAFKRWWTQFVPKPAMGPLELPGPVGGETRVLPLSKSVRGPIPPFSIPISCW